MNITPIMIGFVLLWVSGLLYDLTKRQYVSEESTMKVLVAALAIAIGGLAVLMPALMVYSLGLRVVLLLTGVSIYWLTVEVPRVYLQVRRQRNHALAITADAQRRRQAR
jgi:fatty acid desaturase